MPQIVHITGLDPHQATRLIDEFVHLGAMASPGANPDQVALEAAADALVILPLRPVERFRTVARALEARNNGATPVAVLPDETFGMCQIAFRAGAFDVLAMPITVTAMADLLTTAQQRRERDRTQVKPLKDMERDAIASALFATRGSVSKTARALGIGRSTLYRKLEQYNLDVPR